MVRRDRPTGKAPPSSEAGRSVTVDLLDDSPDLEASAIVSPSHGGNTRRYLPLLILPLLALLVFVLAELSDTDEVADPAPSEAAELEPAEASTTTTTVTTTEPPFDVGSLPVAPAGWLDGASMVWIEGDELRMRDIASGEDAGSFTTRIQIPPLPEGVQILNAPNRTFGVVRDSPVASGLISKVYRTVRLPDGPGENFGFVSDLDNGGYEISTGTLWGPSIQPLFEVGSDVDVSVVDGRGIIISYPTGRSEIVSGTEVSDGPPRLGRIVDANTNWLVGVHCDAVGVCVGRVAQWDGTDERQIDAADLAKSIVRISPLDGSILTWENGAGQIRGSDGTVRRWIGGPPVDERMFWDADSNLVLWISGDSLIALDPVATSPRPHHVQSVGDVTVDTGAELLFLRS